LVEHHWKDEASRNTLWFFHDIAYRENNQTLHVSSASLNAIVRLSEVSENLIFSVGPRPDMIDRALFGAFWMSTGPSGLVHERFGIELDDKTRAEVFTPRDFVTLTDEQMRKTARNDPCPCGSGQKFKKCHGLAV
jgi:hypothetical protein